MLLIQGPQLQKRPLGDHQIPPSGVQLPFPSAARRSQLHRRAKLKRASAHSKPLTAGGFGESWSESVYNSSIQHHVPEVHVHPSLAWEASNEGKSMYSGVHHFFTCPMDGGDLVMLASHPGQL